MKTSILFIIKLMLISSLFISLFTSFTEADENAQVENTSGTVTFTVTTLNAGGTYAPRHVLAIWVEKNGVFVKSRKVMANQRKQYLYKWMASSNNNVTDAITGATLTQPQTHTVQWNCTDLSGNVVPDGEYTILIEFTDKHAQGPFYAVNFQKGTEPVNITPPNQQYIINMQLTYVPDIVVTADFSANITQACEQQEIIFTDNSTGATSWLWNFGAGSNPPTATTQGPHTVTYSTSGAKTVSLTVNGAVTSTKNDYIQIEPIPVAGFIFEVVENIAIFANTSQFATSWLWDFGDGETSTEFNPIHQYWQNGEFTVTLTATSDDCGSDTFSDVVIITGVGIDDRDQQEFEIFPNPTSGAFNIFFERNLDKAGIRIIDLQGGSVFSSQLNINGKASALQDPDLKPGLYLVEVQMDGKNYRRKLVVN